MTEKPIRDNSYSNKENRPLSDLIFGDKKPSLKSTNSAARYSYKIDSADSSPSVLPPLNKDPLHRRNNSHHRQRSIYYPPDSNIEQVLSALKNESPVHIRNLSDADSVVYLAPGDSLNNTYRQEGKKHEFQISIIETAAGSIVSTEKPGNTNNHGVPMLGLMETMAFCRFCRKEVHTKIEINSCYDNKILNVMSSIISCCSCSNWMGAIKVHKCPYCSLVLGKSR